jgi:hypothetical protein
MKPETLAHLNKRRIGLRQLNGDDLIFSKKPNLFNLKPADFSLDLGFERGLHVIGIDRELGSSELLKLFIKQRWRQVF